MQNFYASFDDNLDKLLDKDSSCPSDDLIQFSQIRSNEAHSRTCVLESCFARKDIKSGKPVLLTL